MLKKNKNYKKKKVKTFLLKKIHIGKKASFHLIVKTEKKYKNAGY